MESAMKGYGQYSGLCRMIGVSVDEKGRVSTVMELMAGDLRNFIDHKNLRLSYKDKIDGTNVEYSAAVDVYGFGMRCWDEDPHQRPGWGEILDNLTQECLSLQRQDQHDVSAFRESMLANSHR
ncbi:unnamed protein product [Sphagnum balticum]